MLPILLLLQVSGPPAPTFHDATHYDVTLVPADTGTHLLGEVQTSWRLRAAEPVGALLDSSMRVVRVLVDGKPNTRISRTMYGRSGEDIVVPHQKQAGDTITTRIRYHGLVHDGAWLGTGRGGARAFVAGGWDGSRFWLPVPGGAPPRVSAAFHIQAPLDGRAIANGVLERIDTLPYGHATWHYRLDSAAPLPALAVAVGQYAVTRLSSQVEVWTRPADSAWAAAGPFRRAGEILEYMAGMLGPYPYARLTHVAVPAIERAASGGSLALYPEERFRDGGIDERLVARETALQWLDGADSSVADGIATYLAALRVGTSDSLPPGASEETRRAVRRMHQLRGELGDRAFRRALRDFAEGQRQGRGSATDLTAAMERARGRGPSK
jgi:aminopeptidase N